MREMAILHLTNHATVDSSCLIPDLIAVKNRATTVVVEGTRYSLNNTRSIDVTNALDSKTSDEQPVNKAETPPPWKETVDRLNAGQRTTAEISFATLLLRTLNRKADRIYMLAQADAGEYHPPTEEDRNKHVFGVLDRYSAVQQGEETVRKYDLQWGEEGQLYADIVRKSLPRLELKRDEIFAQAQSWDETDGLRAIQDARALVDGLPSSQRTSLFNQVGLTPETFVEHVTRRGKRTAVKTGEIAATTTAFLGSTALLDGWCVGAAIAAEKLGSLEKLPPIPVHGLDARYAIGGVLVGLSYWTWLNKAIKKAAEAQFKLHKKTGISVSIGGKLMDELLSSHNSDTTEDAASNSQNFRHVQDSGQLLDLGEETVSEDDVEKNFRRGYRLTEIGKESLYYAYAGAEALQGSYLDAMTFIAVANFAAALYEWGFIGHGTEVLLKVSEQKHRIANNVEEMRKRGKSIFDRSHPSHT